MRFCFTLVFLLFFAISMGQGISVEQCREMRTGSFIMESPGGGDIYIKRKRKKQKEYYLKKGKKYVFAIEWTDDCSYVLTFRKGNSRHDRQFKGKTIRAKVVDFSYDTYTCLLIDGDGNQTEVLITIR